MCLYFKMCFYYYIVYKFSKISYIYVCTLRSMCSHAFWAIYFLGFYMFKIPLFPRCLFSPSSLSGPMRFSHPVDTTDRRNTKVHLGVWYRQYQGFLLSSCPPALLSVLLYNKNYFQKVIISRRRCLEYWWWNWRWLLKNQLIVIF